MTSVKGMVGVPLKAKSQKNMKGIKWEGDHLKNRISTSDGFYCGALCFFSGVDSSFFQICNNHPTNFK